MIALALREWQSEEERGLLRWILPASVSLHLLAFAWMPTARHPTSPPPLDSLIQIAEVPAPPTPPPTQPIAEPTRVVATAPTAAAPRTVAPAAPPTTAPPPAADAPMDFTSAVFSNDGPGLAIGTPGPRSSPGVAAGPTVATVAPAPAPPRIVPPASLARRPRAPGLDVELERQYPAEARRSAISGTAVLRVRILPDGRIGEVQIVSESWRGFGPACERTVRGARWEPPIDREGTPVSTEITYTCRFEVRS